MQIGSALASASASGSACRRTGSGSWSPAARQRHLRDVQRADHGVFFGVEIICAKFSIDSLFTVMLSAMLRRRGGDPVPRPQPFLVQFRRHRPAPPRVPASGRGPRRDPPSSAYYFKTIVYRSKTSGSGLEEPSMGPARHRRIALGLILLALPQMYGVGYPVMDQAIGGGYVLWFLLRAGRREDHRLQHDPRHRRIRRVLRALTVHRRHLRHQPSVRFAATLFGPATGQPHLYAVVAIGAVFTSAARLPSPRWPASIELHR